MSNEINKIKTATGEKIFPNLPPDSTGKLAESLWHIFEPIDSNYDRKIVAKEISVFYNNVQVFASKDGNATELSDEEATLLAEHYKIKNTAAMQSMNISNKDLIKMIMSYTASEALLANMGEALHGKWYQFGFAKADTKQFETLFNELNETNIGHVWREYPTSLAKDIMLYYPKDKAEGFFDKAFQLMQTKAKLKNIKIDTLVQQYKGATDMNQKQTVLDEMASRIHMADQALMCVLKTANVDKVTYKEASSETKEQIVNIAKNAGAVVSDDLYGDGVLGNTQSVNASKSRLPAMKILPILNKILSNPILCERAQACVRKEGTYLIVNFPNDRGYQVIAEEHLADKHGRTIQDGVIGDGDTSNFLITIYDKLQKDGKIELLNDEMLLEQYIINLITPNY